jgi:RNA polymerase sigma factor (sigma-70 family)
VETAPPSRPPRRSTEERNCLAAENLALAQWVARRYAALARDRDAVFSEAMLGMLEAAERFDPEKGKFSTLAVLTCKHAVFNELKRQRRVPFAHPLYVLGENGDELERQDLPNVPPPDVEPPLMIGRMREALEDLPPLERRVLELRWGLAGDEHSFPDVARVLGIGREKARKAELRARHRLRRILEKRPRFHALPLGKGRKW